MKALAIKMIINMQFSFRRATCGVVLLAALSACGGGSGGGSAAAPVTPVPPAEAPRYLLGGTVTGLSAGASVVLANGADKVTVSANGAFSFPVKLLAGAAYEGKVESASPGIGCSIANGAATVGNADVGTLAIRCLPVVLAGVQEQIQRVDGMVQDTVGNYYIADASMQVIHKLAPDGTLSTYAGVSGKVGAEDGAASAATFYMEPGWSALAIDRNDNLYVADSCNGLLRKITPAGTVSTLAGRRRSNCDSAIYDTDAERVYADGQGALAEFGQMRSLAVDRNGDLLIAGTGVNQIRRVTAAGMVSSSKFTAMDNFGNPVNFFNIGHIAVNASGTVYFSNRSGSAVFRLADGVGTVVAGNFLSGSYDGKGANSRFTAISGMAFDRSGNLVVADLYSLRRVTVDGDVTTILGPEVADTRLTYPGWISLGPLLLEASGAVVVYDFKLHQLSRLDAGGALSIMPVLPGNTGPKDGVGAAARLASVSVSGMCSDPAGNIYLIDKADKVLRRVAADGTYSLYAGIVGRTGIDDGARQTATMLNPNAIACDKDGSVYFADRTRIPGVPFVLRKIDKEGMVSTLETLPGNVGFSAEYSLAIDKDGYMAWGKPYGDGIYRRAPGGTFTMFVSFKNLLLTLGEKIEDDTQLILPYSMAFDSKGVLYFADQYHQVIFKADRSGAVSIFAGTLYKSAGGDGAPGVGTLSFAERSGLAVDQADNLYLSGQGRVRKIDAAGVISTPQLAWGYPSVQAITISNGTLYGYTVQAIVQTPLP